MKDEPAEKASERIVKIRKAFNKTPVGFANTLCLSRSYVYEMEKGRREVNDRIAKLIAMTFGVNEEWLKTGAGEMFDNSGGEVRRKIEELFDKLCPDFQEYVLRHLDLLLELQNKRQ
jgi:transcriptional regulator with XRE-family HTH domain